MSRMKTNRKVAVSRVKREHRERHARGRSLAFVPVRCGRRSGVRGRGPSGAAAWRCLHATSEFIAGDSPGQIGIARILFEVCGIQSFEKIDRPCTEVFASIMELVEDFPAERQRLAIFSVSPSPIVGLGCRLIRCDQSKDQLFQSGHSGGLGEAG